MADIPGLVETESGQRLAWNGWDWVPVGRDFDPRDSAFMAGLQSTTEALTAGVGQIRAAIAGDDAALEALAQERGQTDNEMSVLRQESPFAAMAGEASPYLAGAALGGLGAAAAGGGALAAGAAATGVDVALGGLTYGTPGERAFNMALAAGIPAAGAGIGWAARRAALASGIGRRAQAAGDYPLTTQAAGGSIQGGNPADTTLAQRLAGRMMSLGSLDVDADELARTARARELAQKYGVSLSPAMRTGSRSMRQLEDSLASNPYSAKPGLRVKQTMLDAVDKEIRDFFLPGWQGPLDEDFLAEVRRTQSEGFEQIRAQTPDKVPVMDIEELAQEIAAPGQAAWGGQGSAAWKRFDNAMDQLREEGNMITRERAWSLNQQWREQADRLMEARGRSYEEGQAMFAAAQAIEDVLINAPGSQVDRQHLNLLRKQYRAMEALRRANAFSGIDGLKLGIARNALAREFREMAEGTGFPDNPELRPLERVFDVFKIYQDLFRASVGDSGTATRLSTQDISPAGMGRNFVRGLAASMYYNEPQIGLRAAGPLAGAAGLAGVAGAGGVAAFE